MNNKQIRGHLSGAVTRAASDNLPDTLNKILFHSEQQKEIEQTVQTQTLSFPQPFEIQSHTQNKRKAFVWVAAAAVAAAILLIIIPLAYSQFSVDSIIGIDVNPSLELRTNHAEKVLSVTALNNDAEIVLDGMNLKNVDLDVAVNALIGSMLKHGYVDKDKNSVLITVENSNTKKGFELQEMLAEKINSVLHENALDGAVISHTVSEDDQLRALAEKYNISIGKAALIDLLVSQDDRLNFEDIAKLGINEINLLITAREPNLQGMTVSGHANSSAYIGEEKAKASALDDADVNAEAATFTKAKLDYDEGRMVYEVEFYTADADYEYEIDALDGRVISHDKDFNHHEAAPEQTHDSSPIPQNATIGEEKAKSIALTHAKLSAADVTFINVHLNEEDSRSVYDIEFCSKHTEYDYEIDAVTGAILSVDQDIESFTPPAKTPAHNNNHNRNHHRNAGSGANAGTNANANSSYIGESTAKSTALSHARLAESDVTNLHVKLDNDDGQMIYEVEFEKGHMEYSYDIDAIKGTILKWDNDYDD